LLNVVDEGPLNSTHKDFCDPNNSEKVKGLNMIGDAVQYSTFILALKFLRETNIYICMLQRQVKYTSKVTEVVKIYICSATNITHRQIQTTKFAEMAVSASLR
jgi:hypothetical protein